jgi:hypothetical protein
VRARKRQRREGGLDAIFNGAFSAVVASRMLPLLRLRHGGTVWRGCSGIILLARFQPRAKLPSTATPPFTQHRLQVCRHSACAILEIERLGALTSLVHGACCSISARNFSRHVCLFLLAYSACTKLVLLHPAILPTRGCKGCDESAFSPIRRLAGWPRPVSTSFPLKHLVHG